MVGLICCSKGRADEWKRRCSIIALVVAVLASGLFLEASGARAQDMEPRAFSAFPVDTNFLILSYLRTTGGVSLDPSLPVSNVQATINTGSLAAISAAVGQLADGLASMVIAGPAAL